MATGKYRTRFMANNFLSVDEIANYSASSEIVQFPFSNLFHESRFKSFKFSGNFELTTSNNLFYLSLTEVGITFSVAITVGVYTATSLALQIQTDLQNAGHNISVGYSSTTRKFTITNPDPLSIRFSSATNAIWDAIGFTTTSDAFFTPIVGDEPRNHTSEKIKIDLGFERVVTSFNLISPKNIKFPISDQAEFITLKANNVDDFTAPPLIINLSRTDQGIFHFIDDVVASYRYWEFEFSDNTNTIGSEGFRFGHVYLGDYITSTDSNIGQGFSKKLNDNSSVSKGQTGAEFFRKKIKYWSYSGLRKATINETERRELEQLFYDIGKTDSFYISFDPLVNISFDISELTKYVRFDREPTFRHVFLKKYDFDFSIKEVI